MNEIPSNLPEQSPNIYLTQLREALNSKDEKLLREVVNGIQIYVNGTYKWRMPLDDNDLHKLLETWDATIPVGIGTQGQRIRIKDGQLYLHADDAKSEKEAREFRLNFQRLFNLPDLQDLRTRF